MNKNNFMKAMSMIDEDLIKEADTSYEPAAEPEESGVPFSEKEHLSSVTGVDVYHSTIWKKFLGIAAAFVLVAGAAGGGIYYLSQLKNKDNNIIENEIDYDTIYDKLKAHKDKYEMSSVVCVYDGTVLFFPHDDEKKEKFFEYMDKFDMTEEIEKKDISKTPRHLRFNFMTDEKIFFTFEIYENGDCSWTEKDSDKETTTYHRLADGKEMFDYFVESYNVESCQPLNWKDVNPEEIKAFIDECFMASLTDSNIPPNTAAVHNGSDTKTYEIIDQDEINKTILNLSWIRADGFDYTNYADIYGMKINKDGYIAGNYNGYNVVYRIDKYKHLDDFNKLWQALEGYRGKSSENNDVDPRIIRELFENSLSAKYYFASMYNGYTVYKITDPEKFRDEIVSLGWVTCSAGECEWGPAITDSKKQWTDEGGYIIGDTAVSPKGYLSKSLMPLVPQDDKYYYKLKNEEDAAKFNKILEDNLAPNKYSEIYLNSSKDYSNLRAHYTYEYSYGVESEDVSIKGLYIEDKANKRIYATGEGKKHYRCGMVDFNGMIDMEIAEDKGRDDLVFENGFCYDNDYGFYKIRNKDTGEIIDIGSYNDGGNIRVNLDPLLCGIRSFCGTFQTYDDSGAMIDNGYREELKELAFDVSNKDGKIEYHILTEDKYKVKKETWLVFTEKWQLISYEIIYTYSEGDKTRTLFRLDDYEYDSPDFTMEDVMPEFEKLEKESKEKPKD